MELKKKTLQWHALVSRVTACVLKGNIKQVLEKGYKPPHIHHQMFKYLSLLIMHVV